MATALGELVELRLPHDRTNVIVPAALAIVSVRYADGGRESYLLPLVLADVESAAPPPAVPPVVTPPPLELRDGGSGRVLREPRPGDGAWSLLVELMRAGAELRGAHGTLRFRTSGGPRPALARRPDERRAERQLAAEQTNTSVVLDERVFLKLYRRLDVGLNPEVEVLEFLAARSFAGIPSVLGSAVYLPDAGEPSAVALAQDLVRGASDAWSHMLELAEGSLAAESFEDAVARTRSAADAVGRLTAEMHAALASGADDPAFPARDATLEERREWLASAERQLEDALAALPGADHDELRRVAVAARAALAPLGDHLRPSTVTRVHGDYHLGQLLRAEHGGFLVTDFEGEPARPLVERRRPHSPLKDVAGMLRSFDYAAGTVGRRAGDGRGAARLARWRAEAREAFLESYRSSLADAALPRPLPHDPALLRAFEVEKACYEVRYEAANRPDWLWLPAEGLRGLLGGDAGG